MKIDTGRDLEEILFVRLDPETGREVFRSVGAPAIPVSREMVEDFDFAATVANEIEVRLLTLGDEITRGTLVSHEGAITSDVVRERLAGGGSG